MASDELVSIDAESPLAAVIDLAKRDIAARADDEMPLEIGTVYALCAWGKLLNAVSKDHGKLFEDKLNKMPLAELDRLINKHPVVEQAKTVATERAARVGKKGKR